ncbi:unnamed protein product [Microthlaspi erraticum]|uniref:Uncharacterized protein n=1 Tax=Microthlaspi erraticum TaxID=1685480 RepID=A0A6D2KL18_9BRAS|nr:unnamed protein product [Microthlaspi erraticum]
MKHSTIFFSLQFYLREERSLSTHLKLQAFSFSDANSVQIRTQRIEDRRSQRVFSKVQGGGFCVALTSFFFKFAIVL